jgi:hypothetical protein
MSHEKAGTVPPESGGSPSSDGYRGVTPATWAYHHLPGHITRCRGDVGPMLDRSEAPAKDTRTGSSGGSDGQVVEVRISHGHEGARILYRAGYFQTEASPVWRRPGSRCFASRQWARGAGWLYRVYRDRWISFRPGRQTATQSAALRRRCVSGLQLGTAPRHTPPPASATSTRSLPARGTGRASTSRRPGFRPPSTCCRAPHPRRRGPARG